MGKSNVTGARGEREAENMLVQKGYVILHRNWRAGHKEVDLIALQGELLVFVEIKTRSSFRLGFPEESVGPEKLSRLMEAAAVFLEKHPEYKTPRYDVVSVLMRGDTVAELRHLEDIW